MLLHIHAKIATKKLFACSFPLFISLPFLIVSCVCPYAKRKIRYMHEINLYAENYNMKTKSRNFFVLLYFLRIAISFRSTKRAFFKNFITDASVSGIIAMSQSNVEFLFIIIASLIIGSPRIHILHLMPFSINLFISLAVLCIYIYIFWPFLYSVLLITRVLINTYSSSPDYRCK